MLRAVGVVVLASACSFDHGAASVDGARDGAPGDDPNGPWLAGYTRRKPITITAPIASTLTDFPVGIIEGADPQLAASARDDGRDLVFTTADGTTALAHELVRFNGVTGAVEAWVRIPSLTAAATTIYLYYKGPEHAAAGAAAWPARFVGVWHLGATMVDSTSHNHPAIAASSNVTPNLVEGVAGDARDFDGTDDTLVVADPGDGSLDFAATASFSFSVWAKVAQSTGMFDAPLAKGGSTTGDPGYCVLLGSGNWQVKVHDGTTYRDPVVGTEALNRWALVTGVVDRDAQQFLGYRDGAFATMEPIAGFGGVSSTKPLIIGVTDLMPYRGSIDEVRISTGVLSADWIKAEYANLTTSTFAVVGAEQMAP